MYTISKHAQERYGERIKGYETDEAKRNAILAPERITNDINAMIEHGEEVYTGKSISEYNKNTVTVVICDMWILIVDKASNCVVTLYKINLGAGEDLDKEFMSRMRTMIAEKQSEKAKVEDSILDTKLSIEAEIEENDNVIENYKKIIAKLEDRNKTLRQSRIDCTADVDVAEQNLREAVGKLVGRKVF